MITKKSRNEARKKRHRRIWNRVQGSPQRPRLCVFRSLKHIYAQVVDDTKGHTLASALHPRARPRADMPSLPKVEEAPPVGTLVAERACAAGVSAVVFDREGLYHGRVQRLADAAGPPDWSSSADARSNASARDLWPTRGQTGSRDKKCPSLTPTAWTSGSGW